MLRIQSLHMLHVELEKKLLPTSKPLQKAITIILKSNIIIILKVTPQVHIITFIMSCSYMYCYVVSDLVVNTTFRSRYYTMHVYPHLAVG